MKAYWDKEIYLASFHSISKILLFICPPLPSITPYTENRRN